MIISLRNLARTLVPLSVHHNTSLIILDINNNLLELPSRNPAVEQDIGFAVGAVLELRQEEVGHNPAYGSGTSPYVTALACKVPSGGIEHLGGQVDHGNLRNVVGGATNTGAQGAESDGRRLGNDSVGDRSHAAGKDEGDDDAETRLGVVRGVVLGDGGTHSEKDQQSEIHGCTPEVDGPASKPGAEEPRERIGDELEARVDEIELESEVSAHAGL